MHIERSGNDVVKRASELNVEEKASDSASSKKREHKKEEGNGTITENAEGKDVKKQKTEKKSVKTGKMNTKAGEEKNAALGHEEQREREEKKDKEATPKKKATGRAKGTSFGGAKAKKEPKSRGTEGSNRSRT